MEEEKKPSADELIKEAGEEAKRESEEKTESKIEEIKPSEEKKIGEIKPEEPKEEHKTVEEIPKEEPKTEEIKEVKKEEPKPEPKEPFNFKNFYDKEYKKLLLIPLTILLLAIIVIAFHVVTTGDFIKKDVSLKGGLTITIPTEKSINIIELQNYLLSEFKGNDISVRSLKRTGAQIGIIVDSDIDATKEEKVDALLLAIQDKLAISLGESDYTIEFIGSSLGLSFFKEIFIAVLIAFLFMGLVVLIYFKTFIPSIAVILSAFSDIIVTVAIVNLLNIRLSTAGIAAFLMLIGYSVDTDILLSTKVLKRKEGTVIDRIIGAMKTGLMMSLTTIAAVTVALIFTQSDIIRQIMTILLIGLLVDIINTWIQNVSILRIYLEKKGRVKNE